jgi:hypothetical protein
MEISMEIPQQTINRITYDPAIPNLGMYPKECKSAYNEHSCTPMFVAPIFIIVKL